MLVSETGIASGGIGHAEAASVFGRPCALPESRMNRSENFGFLPMGASEQASASAIAPRSQMPGGEGTA